MRPADFLVCAGRYYSHFGIIWHSFVQSFLLLLFAFAFAFALESDSQHEYRPAPVIFAPFALFSP